MKSPTTSRRFGRYWPEEVRVLVEEYAELRELKGTGTKGGVRHICFLADLDKALRAMPTKAYRYVLLHGLLHLPVRDTAEFFGVHPATAQENYVRALTWITDYLNGVRNE